MQQLPCGCRRAGRRNCIEPSCPYPSEVSRDELYFCPAARRRNANRTGEPEVCPVELPAPSLTTIVKTGRCTLHRKLMEQELLRRKRREEEEWQRQVEEDKEREREEAERRKEGGLERIGEESPERVDEKEDSEGKEEGKGVVYGSGNGDGNGMGIADEQVDKNGKGKERVDGLMPGMDADERMHVKAVLARRDKAKFEAMVERSMDSPDETKASHEPAKDKGKQKSDSNKVNISKLVNHSPSPPPLRSMPHTHPNKPFKKLDNAASATALLAQLVGADMIKEGASPSSLALAEARKVLGVREVSGEDVNRGNPSPSPAITEARKVSGGRKVSETRKMFEQNNKPYITSPPVPIPTARATATATAATTLTGPDKQVQSGSRSGNGIVVLVGQTERLPQITSSLVVPPTASPTFSVTTTTTVANKKDQSRCGSRQGSGSIPLGQAERLPYIANSPVAPPTTTAIAPPSQQNYSGSRSGSGTITQGQTERPPNMTRSPVATRTLSTIATLTPTASAPPPPNLIPAATTSPPPTASSQNQPRTVSTSGTQNDSWTIREKVITVNKLYTTLGTPRPVEVTYAYSNPLPAAGGAYEDLEHEDTKKKGKGKGKDGEGEEDAQDGEAWRWEGWGELYDGDK